MFVLRSHFVACFQSSHICCGVLRVCNTEIRDIDVCLGLHSNLFVVPWCCCGEIFVALVAIGMFELAHMA